MSQTEILVKKEQRYQDALRSAQDARHLGHVSLSIIERTCLATMRGIRASHVAWV